MERIPHQAIDHVRIECGRSVIAVKSDMPWSDGVYVEMKLGRYLVVNNTRQPLPILQNRWPTNDGDRYASAVKLRGTELKGKAPPDRARESFIDAAAEADVFTGPVPRYLQMPSLAADAKSLGNIFRDQDGKTGLHQVSVMTMVARGGCQKAEL